MSDPADQRPKKPRRINPRPADPRPPRSASARRLSLLVRLATAADLWERMWRAAVPPLVVVGLFLCVSWLGAWLDVPHLARRIGVIGFGLLLLASCYKWLGVTPLSRRDALKRIDRASGLGHDPASLLEDALANPGRDPATEALWALHKRRAEAAVAGLKAGRPSPRAVDLDRFALRGGILAALFACAVIAGPQRYARVAAAFDFGTAQANGTSTRLDAWIDPPPYTGRPPALLDLASAGARDVAHPQRLMAPAGAGGGIRSAGGRPAVVETSGPLLPPAAPKGPAPVGQARNEASPPVPGGTETRLVLHGDGRLTLRQDGALRGVFDLVAIPDRPPTIMLRAIPRANARGSLTLAYTLGDDYGVAGAEALFADPAIDGTPTEAKPLVAAPKMPLALPGVTNGLGDGDTTADLSDSPWAGAQVRMALVARDEAGNEGRSEPVTLTLPQKPFNNPLARALVEQRRDLVLNPSHRAAVAAALDALMVAPDAFGTTASVYLGLRFAADGLADARSDAQLVAVADFLWGMALQLENGDLSDAEKALRNAEKELRDAIDRHASDAEIQKLTQNLQAAMDTFLKELAQQQKDGDQQQAEDRSGRPSKSISPRDLNKLIDKLKEQARSGNREEARKALDELQDILENLKTAKRQKPDPQSRAMAEGLNQLDQAMRDQQDLRDETFKKDQQGQGQQSQDPRGQDQQGGDQQGRSDDDAGSGLMPGGGVGQKPGQRSPGRSGQGQQGQDQQDEGQQGQGQQGQGQQALGQKGLGQRQQALRDRLASIQKKLKQVGKGEPALDEAGQAMREAEEALGQGEGSGEQAVDAQGRALDAMRKGARKLADAMSKQGGGEGQADADGEGGQGSQGGEENGDADPLGRPRGGTSVTSNSRFDPLGIPAAQRASRVLEELRRRLADPTRAQGEIDYLERLLRSY